jgi:hypothetical protein
MIYAVESQQAKWRQQTAWKEASAQRADLICVALGKTVLARGAMAG